MSGTHWVRIDAGYFSNPKVLRAGRDGAVLHLAAICYLARHDLDDGLLPVEAVDLLALDAGVRRVEQVVASLVKAGLWHGGDYGGDYLVHDYDALNGNRSAAYREKQRSRRRRAEGDWP